MRILRNAIQTPDGTILESLYRHDYKFHIDKNGNSYSVDGGRDYLKRNYDVEDFKDLSIIDNGTLEIQREYIKWGTDYDKNMKRLKKTKWIVIKNLSTEHIYRILELDLNFYMRRLLEDEIIYRESLILKEL